MTAEGTGDTRNDIVNLTSTQTKPPEVTLGWKVFLLWWPQSETARVGQLLNIVSTSINKSKTQNEDAHVRAQAQTIVDNYWH